MKIYPAIDIREGRVVRLFRGDYEKMTVYGDRPAETACSFREQGADRIHIVDLDGAKEGAPRNAEAIGELIRASGLFAEIGGGIRTAERIEAYLKLGAQRVILGTKAQEDPAFVGEMVRAFGERIAVGADARDGRIATHGWLVTTGAGVKDFCVRMRDLGVRTVVCTDISRDGTLEGCNLEVYRELAKIEGLDVIASGGVTTAEEIRTLASEGVAGAILGKALYDGRITLREALDAAGRED